VAKKANEAKKGSEPGEIFRYFRIFRSPTAQEKSHTMSGYLELARRVRARQEESRPQTASEAATDIHIARQSRSIQLDPEGRRLNTAGFEPKERGGKIIWQRPDTGFWVSQEMALHLLDARSVEEDQRG
jgi:hypothetical protein